MSRWYLFLTNQAEKQFSRLPKEAVRSISKAFNEMEVAPLSGDVIRLQGQGYVWRRRIGSYRIIFELIVEKHTVFIYDIMRRTSKIY